MTPTRALWRGPIRVNQEQAKADLDRVAALIREHAPDLLPTEPSAEPPQAPQDAKPLDDEPGTIRNPKRGDKPFPGAAAVRHKGRG